MALCVYSLSLTRWAANLDIHTNHLYYYIQVKPISLPIITQDRMHVLSLNGYDAGNQVYVK